MDPRSIKLRRLNPLDFISLITIHKKCTPATLYYWPGLLQPLSMRRNLLRWFFGNVLTLCALISPRLSKAFMHLQPNESIPYLFIGAFYKKELIGIAFLMIKGKSPLSAEVGIGVIDKWQGKGLGSELMGRIIVEARGLGFKKLTLEVYSSNYRGIKLYKKYRFVEKSIRRDHWGNTVIEMEKYIACPKPP